MNTWSRRITALLFTVISTFGVATLPVVAQTADSDTAEVGLIVSGGSEAPTTTATATATSTATRTSTSVEEVESGAPVVNKLPDTGISPENSSGANWMGAAIAAGFFLAIGGVLRPHSGAKHRVE